MDYRPEKFLEFAQKTKMPPLFGWFLNIGFIGLLILHYFLYFEKNPKNFWGGLIFLLLGFTILKLFLYGITYKVYRYGREAYNDLKHFEREVLQNVKVFVKEFNLHSVKRAFPPDITTKTNYDFDLADIILTEKSMILLGKSNPIGNMLYAAPVEITNGQGYTGLTKAKVTNWWEKNGQIEIEISDPNFNEPIKLVFKNVNEKIKLWLTSAIIQRGL